MIPDFIEFRDPENIIPPILESKPQFIITIIAPYDNCTSSIIRLYRTPEGRYNWQGSDSYNNIKTKAWGWDYTRSKIHHLIRSYTHWNNSGSRQVVMAVINTKVGLTKFLERYQITNKYILEEFNGVFDKFIEGDYYC